MAGDALTFDWGSFSMWNEARTKGKDGGTVMSPPTPSQPWVVLLSYAFSNAKPYGTLFIKRGSL
jgi:hypothetical protein